jgi:hypothetical protein
MQVFVLLMAVLLAMVAGALAWSALELVKSFQLINQRLNHLQTAIDNIAGQVSPVIISAEKIGELSKQIQTHWAGITRPQSHETLKEIPGWQPVAAGFLDLIEVAISSLDQKRRV